MLRKTKILLFSLLLIMLVGCSKDNSNKIETNEHKNKFVNAIEFNVNENLIAKFPNYSFDNNNGTIVSKSEDVEIRLYYFVGIDEMFSDEILSVLLDNQLTSMDDSAAVKFGYIVESMVYQIATDYKLNIDQYEKEWINTDLYNCFRLKNLTNENGLYANILFFYDEENDGIISFVLLYEIENEYLVDDFINALEFSKEFKINNNYKSELDMIYPSVVRIEVEIQVDEYGNIIE